MLLRAPGAGTGRRLRGFKTGRTGLGGMILSGYRIADGGPEERQSLSLEGSGLACEANTKEGVRLNGDGSAGASFGRRALGS